MLGRVIVEREYPRVNARLVRHSRFGPGHHALGLFLGVSGLNEARDRKLPTDRFEGHLDRVLHAVIVGHFGHRPWHLPSEQRHPGQCPGIGSTFTPYALFAGTLCVPQSPSKVICTRRTSTRTWTTGTSVSWYIPFSS